MKALIAIGLMSGTSLDGVDVALVETDGEAIRRLGPAGFRPYGEKERELLHAALAEAAGITDRASRPGGLAATERMVTRAHAEAVESFLPMHRLAAEAIGVVGFHGQTVLHRPKARLTVQIGNGPALAKRLGIRVVHDFRAADVAAGGEGAPLVPVFHRALARTLALAHPIAVVNIGGVANITYIDGDTDPIAFDTGPGNAPIDEVARLRTGADCDRDGHLAARGTVHEEIVASTLGDSYFRRKPPKSLDREQFAHLPLNALSTEDAAATATAVVAESVARTREFLPKAPATWVIAGGGAHNPALISALKERIGGNVLRAEEVGWSADALEAQAFAFLAVRSLRGLPLTFPSTTGAPRPLIGGVLVEPR